MKKTGAHLVLTTSYPRFPGDAAGHFVEADVRALLESGQSVRVLCAGGPRRHDTFGETFVSLGGAALFAAPGVLPRLRAKPWRAFALAQVFFRAHHLLTHCSESDWTVHFLFPFAERAAVLAARKGARLEVVAHGSDVRLFRRLPALLRERLLRRLVAAGATVRFVSEELRSAFREVAPEERWPLFTVVRPSAFFLPELPPREEARRRLCRESEETLVVVLGRLLASKRVDVALGALGLVPKTRVVVLGAGPEDERLRGRFPSVEFRGETPRDVALTWIKAADLVVSASILEGAPTSVREARALGVPVVASRVGDLAAWAELDPELYVVPYRDL